MFGLFKKKQSAGEDEPLVIVPIPALVLLLVQKEREKGAPITQEEVESIRDGAVCMTMRKSHAEKMEDQRGYPDLDLEHCWDEWCARREALLQGGGNA